MTFHYTDPDGDHLHIDPFPHTDGPHITLQIPYGHRRTAAVRIPVDRVEEFIAGLRDTARQAATGAARMNNRIPLDDMTSDALDALYERLDDAEKVIAHLEDGEKLRLRAETELADLRQVARGYCPACGRGDAAPTVADWEQQKQRADQAEAEIAACRRQQWPQQLARAEEAIRAAQRVARGIGAWGVLQAIDEAMHAPQPAPAATQTTDGQEQS